MIGGGEYVFNPEIERVIKKAKLLMIQELMEFEYKLLKCNDLHQKILQ